MHRMVMWTTGQGMPFRIPDEDIITYYRDNGDEVDAAYLKPELFKAWHYCILHGLEINTKVYRVKTFAPALISSGEYALGEDGRLAPYTGHPMADCGFTPRPILEKV